MTHRIIRFVPSSDITPSQFAFQGRFDMDDGFPPEIPRVFDLSFSYVPGEIPDLDYKTHWLMALGEKCSVLTQSDCPRLTHSTSIRVYAKAIESQQNQREFLKHDGQGHSHEYRYDVYEILQGTIVVSCNPWSWDDIWPDEVIRQATLGSSTFQLDFRRNGTDFRVDWLPHNQTIQKRFWRMISCGDSDPLKYVADKTQVWIEKSQNWPVKIFSQDQSQTDVIFRDDRSNAERPELIYSPGIGIEFDGSSGKTVWTPKSVSVDDNTVTFHDADLFNEDVPSSEDLAKITWRPSGFGDEERKPQFQYAPALSHLGSLTLTESSLDAANDNNVFWQYAYRPNPFMNDDSNYRPAWIGYPLPIKLPLVQSTSSFERGLTSELDFKVRVDENSDWRIALAPLSNVPANEQGLLSVVFTFAGEDDSLSKVDLNIRPKHFALKLFTPSVFGFARRMVDANAVPSVVRLTDSLSKAQLCFRNVYSESEPAERRVKLLIDEDSRAKFDIIGNMSAWQHAGRNPLLRFVSPAGRNLLGKVNAESTTIEPLPDSTSGLVESTISGQFSLEFPTAPDEEGDANLDRQLFGTFESENSEVTAGYAIHALFVWLQRAWTTDATISENRLFHRNLILEVIEFFRRVNAQRKSDHKQPIEWTDEHVVRFCRTFISSAAVWGADTTEQREVENYLSNATVASRPGVTMVENDRDWPIANVTLGEEDPQTLTLAPDDVSQWLAYKLNVTFDGQFPNIELAADNELATVQQPLIGSDAIGSMIYDNAGVTKDYSSIETGDGIRMQRVYLDSSENEYYLLDADAPVSNYEGVVDGHCIRLSCFDLLVKVESSESDERVLTPVVDRQAEIGTAGFCALKGDQDEQLNPLMYPRVSYYPLVPLDASDPAKTTDFAIRPKSD